MHRENNNVIFYLIHILRRLGLSYQPTVYIEAWELFSKISE